MDDNFGIEINLKEGQKIVEFPASPELNKYLKKKYEKDHIYYLTEFIGGADNYKIAKNAVENAMEKSLPDNIKDSCSFCKGEGKEIGDKACGKYYLQMNLTFSIASNEFINIIFKNRYIYNDKPQLQKLTIEFFNCLKFKKGEGKMYFLLDKMCRYILNSGFLTLSQIFSKSETLKAYAIINKALDEIDGKRVQNKTLQKEDEDYLELQKEFFESKKRYYKEEIFIENETLKSKKYVSQRENSKGSLNRTDIAYYAYYMNETKSLNLTHPFPSDSAWKQIGELFNKNWKNIQQAYNIICSSRVERLKSTRIKNIERVIKELLPKHDKALELAKDELDMAKLNS